MKNIYIILSFTTLLILASCSSSTSNDMHSMDDGTNMDWTTHEEAQKIEEKITFPNKEKQENQTWTEIDEESIVWDQTMHSMDDGSNMAWVTHEESENHIEWDTHGMDNGSEMKWATHNDSM